MKTILNNTVAPLWVWIVVIVIGSLLAIGIVTSFIVCCTRKIRSRRAKDLEANGLTRKVTLKAGRLVEKTDHLSLTGSRFGLTFEPGPAFMASPTVRGSSPFGWLSEAINRPDSRESHQSLAIASTSPPLKANSDLSNTIQETIEGQPSNDEEERPKTAGSTFAPNMQTYKEWAESISSISDASSISKPLLAVTTESKKARTVNFSRPQPLQPAPTTTRNRLSVINESSRNSFLSISSLRQRMASWVGAQDDERDDGSDGASQTPQTTATEMSRSKSETRISEKAPMLTLSFENPAATSEPLVVSSPPESRAAGRTPSNAGSTTEMAISSTLRQLNDMIRSMTPDLSPESPAQAIAITSPGINRDNSSRHRSASTSSQRPTEGSQRHSRASSVTNFSRKPQIAPHSRSSSLQRSDSTSNTLQIITTNDQSRGSSNTSWLETPTAQATLSEPFDMPIVFRGSKSSVWSQETRDLMTQSRLSGAVAQSSHAPEPNDYAKERLENAITAILETTPASSSSVVQSAVEAIEGQARGRPNEGDERRRGPTRTMSASKGRHVLRKKILSRQSSQAPEVVISSVI